MTSMPLTGKRAERLGESYLRERGLRCAQRNYRCSMGEIDLVMHDGEVLVFVEIRYRANAEFGSAIESIDWRKRRRIVLAARHFLSTGGRSEPRCRFDVLGISGRTQDALTYLWIRDAFTATS